LFFLTAHFSLLLFFYKPIKTTEMKRFFTPAFAILFLIVCLAHQTVAQIKYDQSEGFVAHEWGTFTTLQKSNGIMLDGLQLEEESLPDFVYNLCFCKTYVLPKGYGTLPSFIPPPVTKTDDISNVTVKMETPVIYFYSSENAPKWVLLDVKFTNGSISQWYPNRWTGEQPHETVYFPFPSTFPPGAIDFSNYRQGWIQWKAIVVPLNAIGAQPGSTTNKTWTRPRATASNLVMAEGEPPGEWITADGRRT